MTDTNKGEYYYGMGRRKTSVARVRVFPNGDGSITVNGREAQSYFGQREAHMATIAAPFRVLDLGNKYTMTVRVVGGGTSGQAGAIRHALARALVRMDPDAKHPLRKAGSPPLPKSSAIKPNGLKPIVRPGPTLLKALPHHAQLVLAPMDPIAQASRRHRAASQKYRKENTRIILFTQLRKLLKMD